MTQPSVCCICLTSDRQALTDRAVKCFLAQTYERKWLLIWDTSAQRGPSLSDGEGSPAQTVYHCFPQGRGMSIGALRNAANDAISRYVSEIFIHWDSDDWSAPTRIAEQVEMLISSQAEAVGYNQMLFWDSRHTQAVDTAGRLVGPVNRINQAWLYTNKDSKYCLGTSLCYWRKTWEAKPFPDTSAGEDLIWTQGMETRACSALHRSRFLSDSFGSATNSFGSATKPEQGPIIVEEPRMIAEVHGGNTHHKSIDQQLREPEHLRQWKRIPDWDERLAEIMQL